MGERGLFSRAQRLNGSSVGDGRIDRSAGRYAVVLLLLGAGACNASGASGCGVQVPSGGPSASPADAGATDDVESSSSAPGCSRSFLSDMVNRYFVALQAHDPSMLNTAADVRFTEDGEVLDMGDGVLWRTVVALRLKRSILDTQQCESVTESVVDNGNQDVILGLRLKSVDQAITEIETLVVEPAAFLVDVDAVANSGNDDWETVLPPGERPTRAELQAIVDDYFALFGGGTSLSTFPFAGTCQRSENGISPGSCDIGIFPIGRMTPLHYVIDVDAGTVAGFVMFGGALLDFHMFKVRQGKVEGVRAVVSFDAESRNW